MTTKQELNTLFQEWQAMKARHEIAIAEWQNKTDRGITLTETQAKKAIAIVTSQMAERDELKKRLKGI